MSYLTLFRTNITLNTACCTAVTKNPFNSWALGWWSNNGLLLKWENKSCQADIPKKCARICKHTHRYVHVHVWSILDCLHLWQQLGVAELVKSGGNASTRIGMLIHRTAGKRAYRPFILRGRISNACFLFLTSELNFENGMTFGFIMQRKGSLGEERKKLQCVLQGMKKRDLCVRENCGI